MVCQFTIGEAVFTMKVLAVFLYIEEFGVFHRFDKPVDAVVV